jgi:ATP-dependent protease Clp ATPase subunit
VATVRQHTSGGYQMTMTETELTLIRAALARTERMSRFGIKILDEVDQVAENSRLRREIAGLAVLEASLRSLQKTMSEVDRGGKPAPRGHAGLDRLRSAAGLPVA